MIKPIDMSTESVLFHQLVDGSTGRINNEIRRLKNIGISQKDILIKAISDTVDISRPESVDRITKMLNMLAEGRIQEAFSSLKEILPNDAVIREFNKGVAVMAKGWQRPVLFPELGGHHCGFKWLGWADNPKELTTKQLWESAYGQEPGLIFGAVGNSNIKPEQVKGGCSLSKKELSSCYESSVKDFFEPIFRYFKELGVKTENIGFAFAHSDCGVDKAARDVVEAHKLKGIATTPTEYTQYVRSYTNIEPNNIFPNGAIVADFPYPTVLTRNVGQIEDYAEIYSRLVGKDNPIGIFGGGEHAFVHDTREALIGRNGAKWVPVDIMKDKHGINIPAINENGVVTNAARNILEKVNGSPYEQYRYAFENYLPSNPIKSDIAQYDPQMAMTTIAHARLRNAGMIPKD